MVAGASRSAVAAAHTFGKRHQPPRYVPGHKGAQQPASPLAASEIFLPCITITILDTTGLSVLKPCTTGGKRVVNGSSGILSKCVREVQDSSAA